MPLTKSSIILIIEEDAPTLELYRRELQRDYQVSACQSGEDALRLVKTNDVSVIVLEPAIEDGQGWGLLPALQQTQAGRRVLIVLCSTQDERKRGKLEGAAAFLVKPVLPIELRDCITRVLQVEKL